jgi:hypothetical protein
MTQALRHTLQEQLQTPCPSLEYEAQVKQVYTRYPDSNALLKAAWIMEPAESDIGKN